jgi:hypothetical protein
LAFAACSNASASWKRWEKERRGRRRRRREEEEGG